MLQDLSLLAEFSCRLSFSFSPKALSHSLPSSGLQESLRTQKHGWFWALHLSQALVPIWGWLPSSTQEFLHTENPQLARQHQGSEHIGATVESQWSAIQAWTQLSMERQTTGNTEITCFNSIKITTRILNNLLYKIVYYLEYISMLQWKKSITAETALLED